MLGLDTDRNPATGHPSTYRGADFTIEIYCCENGQRTAGIYRWTPATGTFELDRNFFAVKGREWDVVSVQPNQYRFAVERSLLRIGSAFRFFALGVAGSSATMDFAPDAGAYDLPDTEKPAVKALASVVKRGTLGKLRYRVSDDSGRSVESITVYRRKTAIARLPGQLGDSLGETYYLAWKVRKALKKGSYRFCVSSADEAGNRARPSCAALKVR